jgi:hypothetical protein
VTSFKHRTQNANLKHNQKEINKIESIPLEFNMSWRYSTKSPCASSGGVEARYNFVTLKQGFSKQFYNGSVTM